MTGRLDAQEVYDEAALWAAKVDAGPLAPEEQAALDHWLEQDTRHLGAFAQASAHLVPLSAGVQTAKNRPHLSRRRVLMSSSIAASLAAVASAGLIGFRFFREQRYGTRIGEMRVIPLVDGSVVSLNTDSEVVVQYTKAVRAIELLHGEALFDVAKNRQRP